MIHLSIDSCELILNDVDNLNDGNENRIYLFLEVADHHYAYRWLASNHPSTMMVIVIQKQRSMVDVIPKPFRYFVEVCIGY